MKTTRIGTLLALLLILLSCLYILPVAAEGKTESGSCGDSLTWIYDAETKSLTISGSGAMADYTISQSERAPWFDHCSAIQSVTVESGVTSIGNYAFLYCNNLVSVTLPEGLSAIGSYAFSSCTALTEIVLPEGLSSLKSSAFMSCSSLQNITLPASLTEIGASAFAFCKKLETLSLPRGLTSVGANAFNEVPLRMALFNGTAEEWEAVSLEEPNGKLTEALLIHPDHVFDREVVSPAYLSAEATCETATVYVKSCVCGEKGEELFYDGEPLGHTGGVATCTEKATCATCAQPYGELLPHTPGDEPTCTAPQTCTVCGAQLADQLEHSYTAKDTLAPTCTQNGTRTHTCSLCGDTYEETVKATGHTPGASGSCTAAQTCTVCEAVLAPPLGHSYQNAVVPPTCTEQGYTDRVCIRCKAHVREAYLPPKGHTPGALPTCTSPQTCTVCEAVLAPMLSHSYTSSVTRPATCTQSGTRTHTCSLCGDTYEETLSPLGHTPGEAATCTAPQSCLTCGTVLTSPLGHSLKDSVIPPSCDRQGYTLHTCSACSVSYRDTITPAVEHTPGEAATCTTPEVCLTCGAVLTAPLGHTMENTIVAPTCDSQGYTRHTCTVCSAVYVDTVVPATGHTPGEAATCHAPQTCTVCHMLLAEALPHQYEETTVEATCTADGCIRRACSLCGDTSILSVTPATGHTVGDWTLVNHPDVGEPGRRHKTCEVCSAVLESETFWSDETAPEPESGGSTSAPPSQDEGGSKDDGEEAGCQNVGGNILVIVIVLAALLLLWSLDFRRRH